jgi:hypothetical protein
MILGDPQRDITSSSFSMWRTRRAEVRDLAHLLWLCMHPFIILLSRKLVRAILETKFEATIIKLGRLIDCNFCRAIPQAH